MPGVLLVVLKPVVDKIPIAKLCDLGLAKAIVGEEKQTRKVGTPDYSPPVSPQESIREKHKQLTIYRKSDWERAGR